MFYKKLIYLGIEHIKDIHFITLFTKENFIP